MATREEDEIELTDDLVTALKSLIDIFRQEDRVVRERQLRRCKQLKYLWEGFHRIWWDSVAHDWRVWDLENFNSGSATSDQSYYDKTLNIFKALLESIVAALSISVPGVICNPDDADNSSDLTTAKAGDKIQDLVGQHNDEGLLWLHALFVYLTETCLCAYNYTDEDESYGTYQEKQYKNEEATGKQAICPECGTNMSDPVLSDEERDEYDPDDDDIESHDILFNKDENICPQCLKTVDPEYKEVPIIVERFVGYKRQSKARQCIKIFGTLNCKVPNYAKCQDEMPYIRFSEELHYSILIDEYCKKNPDLAKKIRNEKSSGSNEDPYERWARISPQYLGEYPLNTPTVDKWWFRPCAFEGLADEKQIKLLKNKFPDGVKVCQINSEIAKACNENLDDHWTIAYNPLADYIHSEPLGETLVSPQEITTELLSLTLQSIEHGIPQTFFDPDALDAEAYKNSEATPGMMIQTKPLGGKNISDKFYTTKTASLGPEVQPFNEYIQNAAQMVSGAMPSIWGGAQPNSSRTASQYSMSRAQSLQRLQNPWKILSYWWKNVWGKVIPAFIKDMATDEHYVTKDAQGNFLNVFIRKSELEGKIGSVELETSEQLPINWSQKKDLIMSLLNSQNPLVQQAITAPENLELIKEVIGMEDFVLPGADQRELQFEEIRNLLNSNPMVVPMPNPTGPAMQPVPQQQPSIGINEFDDDNVHAGICVDWLVSEVGRLAKIENPKGYLNVLMHWRLHNQRIQQAQQAQIQQAEAMNQSKVSSGKPITQEPPLLPQQGNKNAIAS